jgi:hypothetical protein
VKAAQSVSTKQAVKGCADPVALALQRAGRRTESTNPNRPEKRGLQHERFPFNFEKRREVQRHIGGNVVAGYSRLRDDHTRHQIAEMVALYVEKVR